MKNITLYDASAILCAGTLSKQRMGFGKGVRGDMNYYAFPTAGLYSLMSYVTSDVKNGNRVIVAFDGSLSTSVRRKYYPDYKENRLKHGELYDKLDGINNNLPLEELIATVDEIYPHQTKYNKEEIVRDVVKHKSIGLQAQLARWMLEKMGVEILYHPELEADDLIYSTAKSFKDRNILLRADDSDLHDCKLIAPKIKMRSVAGRGEVTMYTGQIYKKIIYGDKKDNIYPLSLHVDESKVLAMVKNGLEDVNELADTEALKYKGFTEEEIYYIVKNYYLKMPKILDLDFGEDVEYDMENFRKAFSIFGFNSLLKRLKLSRYYGEDLKKIHKNIYGSLPRYIREWNSVFQSNIKKEDEYMQSVVSDVKSRGVLTDMDKILEIL